MDDTLLVKRAAAGDSRAFEELVKLHQDKVYSLALRYTGNAEDAFDISQEVFLKVWRALPGFKNESRFSTWLYRIAMNVCTDLHRKKSHIQTVPLTWEDEEPVELPDVSHSPEQLVLEGELFQTIRDAVAGLKEEWRQVFLMREVGDMSYTEIAVTLGIEEGTVKSRLFRARKQLQEVLQKSGNLPSVLPSKQGKGGDK